MAALSCQCPSTTGHSVISLQRQEHGICHADCKVKSGNENLRHEAFEVSSVLQYGLPLGKTFSITMNKHGIDDLEVVPITTNVEKGLNKIYLSNIHVESRRSTSQNLSLASAQSRYFQDENLLSIAVPTVIDDRKLKITVHNISERGPWDLNRDRDSTYLKSKSLFVADIASIALVDDKNTVDLKVSGISVSPDPPELDNEPKCFPSTRSSNSTSHDSCKAKQPILESLLSPLRCLKQWIVNSLRRAFLSFKDVKTSIRGIEAAHNDKESFNARGRSSDLQATADLTPSSMSIGAENDIPWEFIKRFLDNPAFVKFRVSISMANLTMTLSTFLCRALPILSDLKRKVILKGVSVSFSLTSFGGGIMLDPAVSNLAATTSHLLVHLAIVWVLWSLKRITRAIIGVLRRRGAVEKRVFNILVLTVEILFGAMAAFTIISSLASSQSSLAVPLFVALALACKDFFQNYFAGFFLLSAHPIQPGQIVSIPCYYKDRKPIVAMAWRDCKCRSGWFEGVCESVGLTYTVLRNAQCRFQIPNSVFMKREFLVVDASQGHFNESISGRSMESVEIAQCSIDDAQRKPRLAAFPKGCGKRFDVAEHNLASKSFKLHQRSASASAFPRSG